MESSKHLSSSEHLIHGPIVIDDDGSILSGHERHKELSSAYQSGDPSYKNMLINHSIRFGIDPTKVARMKQPVLVRRIAHKDMPHK